MYSHNTSFIKKLADELNNKEIEKDKVIHVTRCRTVIRKMKKLITAEKKGLHLSDEKVDKFIMTPLEFMETAFVRISWRNLYRRYRQVRIMALTECLTIVNKAKSAEEAQKEIRDKLIELGQAQKLSQDLEKVK